MSQSHIRGLAAGGGTGAGAFGSTIAPALFLSEPGVALLGVLLVKLLGVVVVDMAVAGAGDRVDGTLALLEAGRRDLGGVPFITHSAVTAVVLRGGRRAGAQVGERGDMVGGGAAGGAGSALFSVGVRHCVA